MPISVDDISAKIEADGVCHVPSVFGPDETNEMRRAIFEALAEISPDRQYHDGGQIQWRIVDEVRWPGLMFWPALISESLRDVRRAPQFSQIIQGLIGSHVRQMNNQWYFRLPGDGDQFNIHVDRIFRTEITDEAVLERRYYQTIIAVDPVTAENGGVEFFLGSHRGELPQTIEADRSNLRSLDEKLHAKLSETYQPMIFDLSPGDMLIWNLGVAHCSRANTSGRTRMTYMNGFCDADASQGWPPYLVDGKVVELNGKLIPRRA